MSVVAYEGFASLYDFYMNETEYDAWVDYMLQIWRKLNFRPALLCELGCGTGNLSARFFQKGYDVIGIDNSPDMLSIAKNKQESSTQGSVLYLCQDMREFELYGTVDCIYSLFDSLNYITQYDDLVKVFYLVNTYLNPKGYFIFDLNTEYKFCEILADNTFSQVDADNAYIWENQFDAKEKINEYYINFFQKGKDNKYMRFEEWHYERAYSLTEVKKALQEAGLEFCEAYDAFTFDVPNDKSERVYFVAREHGK